MQGNVIPALKTVVELPALSRLHLCLDIHDVKLHRTRPAKFIDLRIKGHVDAIAHVDAGLPLCGRKKDGLNRSLFPRKPQFQMSPPAHFGKAGDGEVKETKDRFRIAVSVGFHEREALNPFDRQHLQVWKRHIDVERGDSLCVTGLGADKGIHTAAKGRYLLLCNRKAGRQSVPAIAL